MSSTSSISFAYSDPDSEPKDVAVALMLHSSSKSFLIQPHIDGGLPAELWIEIFSNLSDQDIRACSLVCISWNEATKDRWTWKSKLSVEESKYFAPLVALNLCTWQQVRLSLFEQFFPFLNKILVTKKQSLPSYPRAVPVAINGCKKRALVRSDSISNVNLSRIYKRLGAIFLHYTLPNLAQPQGCIECYSEFKRNSLRISQIFTDDGSDILSDVLVKLVRFYKSNAASY